MSNNKKYIIIYNNGVFASPNQPDIAFKLPPPQDHIDNDIKPQSLHHINWSDNERPYLPFMLQRNTFSSPLLRCLNYTYHSLPIEYRSGGWGLSETVIASWKTLETLLLLISDTLGTLSKHFFPADLRHWRYPSSYDITNTFDTEKYARGRINGARNAFLPLLAYCTYTITLFTRQSDLGINDEWYKVLIQNNMQAPTVDAVRSSEIARFDLPRAGIIINAATCTFANHIYRMVKANIPVYIYWGTVTSMTSAASLMDTSRPTYEEVHHHLHRPVSHAWANNKELNLNDRWDQLPMRNPSDVQESPSPPVPAPTEQHAASTSKPVRMFDQKPGETWEVWVERRKKIISEKIKNEDPVQKNARETRLKDSARGPSKKSTVFYWSKDWDTGVRLRTKATKGDFYELWKTYRKARCHFDPVHNEWDLCSEIEADLVDNQHMLNDNDMAANDNNDNNHDHLPPIIITSEQIQSMEREQQLLASIALRKKTLEKETPNIFGVPKSITASSHLPFTPMNLEHALGSQYGLYDCLSFNKSYQDDFEKKQLSTVTDVQWVHMTKWYTQKPPTAPALSDRQRSIVQYFTTKILSFNPAIISDLPSEFLWDIRPSHPQSVVAKLLGSPLRIERIPIDSNIMYEIKLNDNTLPHLEVEWRLFIKNPLTVLQCIREDWGPGLRDIVMRLVSIGAPFHMVKVFTSPPHSDVLPNVLWLSYRNQDYQPTMSDYMQYRSTRNKILRQDARCAAAALRTGGILWRLAMEVLNPTQVLDVEFEDGCVQFHDNFWEPKLTDAEVNAICGVYEVYTGSGDQTAHKSWWPKPNTWVGSGKDVGYWSGGCEEWYQQRLMLIESQMTNPQTQESNLITNAKLKNAKEWGNSLTFQIKKTRALLKSHRAAADRTIAYQYLP